MKGLMGMLASCLLFVLTPQEPTPPTTGPTPVPVQVTAPQDAPSTLAALEKAGEKADQQQLVALTTGEDAAIAARAAWLLAKSKDKTALAALHEVTANSPHADARAQAMQALTRLQDVGSTATAIAALQDEDRRVRTLAAQLLGRTKRPSAIEPLLALIDESRTGGEKGLATDLQAALLALNDLGAADSLLRAATALHDSPAEGTGEALAFCCQGLVPKLGKDEQVTFLLAILAHRETLVRRYAIGRLAELEDPATAKALEGRLATEGDELRPLVQMALAQIRKDKLAPPTDEMARASHNLQALVHTTKTWWATLDTTAQAAVAGGPVALLIVVALLLRGRRRRAQAAAAAATIAMVQPSDEFVAQTAAEADRLAADAEALAETENEAAPVARPAPRSRWQGHATARR
jgi:HEAT repeat protein